MRSPFTFWQRPIISICWGHRDSRLLMASGPALYVVRVEHRVSSLQLLCQQAIASALREDKDVSKLALPPRLCSYLSTAFIPTIKVEPSPLSSLSHSPSPSSSSPPLQKGGQRQGRRLIIPEQEHRHGLPLTRVWVEKACGPAEFRRIFPHVHHLQCVHGGLAS